MLVVEGPSTDWCNKHPLQPCSAPQCPNPGTGQICQSIYASGGALQVVVSLQKGGNWSGDNLWVVEVNMMRSRHRPVLIEGVRAVSLHCRPVLSVPTLL